MGMKQACSRTLFDLINLKIITKMGPFLGVLRFLSRLFSGENTSSSMLVSLKAAYGSSSVRKRGGLGQFLSS